MELKGQSGFPGGSEDEVSACNVGDLGSIPRSVRSPGEGNGNPLQYSCLENSMDGEVWWATVYRAAKESDTSKVTSLSFFLSFINTDFIFLRASLWFGT